MPWTKIDDNFHSHPKTIAAGNDGVALFIIALSWCGGSLTDGFIPEAQVRRLSLSENWRETADKLVRVGLWEIAEGGYQVHDYLDYNPSAKQVKKKRALDAERQAAWRGNNAQPQEKEENGNAVTNAVTNAAPVPVPVPVPSPKPVPCDDIAPVKSNAPPQNHPPTQKTPPTIAKIMAEKRTKAEWLTVLESEKESPSPRSTLITRIEAKIRAQEPAILAYKQITGKSPPIAWCDDLVSTVQDCERWRDVVKTYVGQGWNPSNVANMLEFYKRNDIPGSGNGGNRNDKKSPTKNEPVGFQGIRDWLEEEL